MRSFLAITLFLTMLMPVTGQTLDKELVATFSGPENEGAIVSELVWDGGTLIIQSAAMQPDGKLASRYFAAAGANMTLRHLEAAPESAQRYWKMKASRVSPTRLGIIRVDTAAHTSTGYSTEDGFSGIAGGAISSRYMTHEVHLGRRLIHRRVGPQPPYDGEVWAWSAASIGRIAYVDGKGDLWIARADGSGAERILQGPVTLPAWSEDGRLIAVAERKDSGKRWDVSIVRVPEQFRK